MFVPDVQVRSSSAMSTVLHVGPEAQGTGWKSNQTTSRPPEVSDAHPARPSVAPSRAARAGIAGMISRSLAVTVLTLTGKWKQGDLAAEDRLCLVPLGSLSWLWPLFNVFKGNKMKTFNRSISDQMNFQPLLSVGGISRSQPSTPVSVDSLVGGPMTVSPGCQSPRLGPFGVPGPLLPRGRLKSPMAWLEEQRLCYRQTWVPAQP